MFESYRIGARSPADVYIPDIADRGIQVAALAQAAPDVARKTKRASNWLAGDDRGLLEYHRVADKDLTRKDVSSIRASDYDDLWLQLKKLYAERRGWEPGSGVLFSKSRKVPKTTYLDVFVLMQKWNVPFREAGRKVLGQAMIDEWNDYRSKIIRLFSEAGKKKIGGLEVYPDNEGFWYATRRLSLTLASAEMVPSQWEIAWEAIKERYEELRKGGKGALDKAVQILKYVAIGGGIFLFGSFILQASKD